MTPREPTVYIDPGVQYFGWALADEAGRLSLCGKTTRDAIGEVAQLASRAVIERPWGKGANTTQRDIDALNIAVGEYGYAFKEREYRYPYTTPKPIRHERAMAALTPDERLKLPKFITHQKHILCAVYILLRDTGRIRA